MSGDSPDYRLIVTHRSLEDRTGIVATVFGSEVLINKGSFGETLLLGAITTIYGGGFFIEGTALDDRFDIALGFGGLGGLVGLTPGRGSDTVRAAGFGHVGLDFGTDSNGTAATQGAVVNLVTGIVANDGFGFADRLIIGDSIDVSVTLTESADILVALAKPGTLRGGGGVDTLDYGKVAFTSGLYVDLGAGFSGGGGPALNSIWGEGFGHTIESFENLIGSRDQGDRLFGTGGANLINGLGGDDTIMGDGFRAAYAPLQVAQVYRLYQALDGAPDPVGLHALTARLFSGGYPLGEVATVFVGSAAFRNTYDALDDAAFVALLYHNVLNRAPDDGGLAYWLDRLEGGAGRAQVVLGFSESRESMAGTRVDTNHFAEAGWTDDVFRLYQATLDQVPDAAGFVDWLGRLGGGTRFLSAVESLVSSAGFQATYGGLDDRAFVALLYRNVLDRAPDAAGLADWLGRLAGGTTRAGVVEGFVQSREFTNATADAVKDYVRGLDGGDTLDGGAGDNRLWGGMLADEFVFDADDMAHHRVMDFEGWDFLTFRDFGYDDAQDIRARMTQTGADVVFQDQGVTVTLVNTQLAGITDDSLIFA